MLISATREEEEEKEEAEAGMVCTDRWPERLSDLVSKNTATRAAHNQSV